IHSDTSDFVQTFLPGKIGVEFIQQGKEHESASVAKGVGLCTSPVNWPVNTKIP
ncbi:unnamed protein product, partial [Bubo scandiacus]